MCNIRNDVERTDLVEHLSVAIPAPSCKADSLRWMKQTNLAPAITFAMIQLFKELGFYLEQAAK